jgi:hypothetical protein
MAITTMPGDLVVSGTLTPGAFNPPALSIGNAAISAAAGIVATKLQHQHTLNYRQNDGSDVVAAIVPLMIVRGVAAEVVDIEVVCIDAPSGGDKTFTVDLGVSNAASPAPATILTTPRTYPNATADATVLVGSIATAALAAGDTLVLTVAVSGSTGTQGQGLVVTVTVREDAE